MGTGVWRDEPCSGLTPIRTKTSRTPDFYRQTSMVDRSIGPSGMAFWTISMWLRTSALGRSMHSVVYSTANLREGKYEESGYRYLQDADLSIQGVDSNLAWDHSLRVARAIEIPIDVRFEWRNKEAAARPGEEAILEWAPQAS